MGWAFREKDVWKGREHSGGGANNDRDDLFFKNNAIDSILDVDVTHSSLPKKEDKERKLDKEVNSFTGLPHFTQGDEVV